MIGAILAATVLMAQAAPAAAGPVAAAAPAGPVLAKRNEDLICKQEQVLGTLFPKKVCYTRAEQEERTKEDQSNLDHQQRSQYQTFQK